MGLNSLKCCIGFKQNERTTVNVALRCCPGDFMGIRLAHCTSLLQAASAAEAGRWFWFVGTALVGPFAIVPPLNEGKGRLRRWEEGMCEGNQRL